MSALAGSWWRTQDLTVPRQSAVLRAHPAEGGALLFDPRTGGTVFLNETAYAVWRRCDGHRSLEQLAEWQCTEFETDLATAVDHVEQLIALFASSNLIEVSDCQ